MWVRLSHHFTENFNMLNFLDEPDEPEFNISRLWRDTASNSVWEGTTNVLASETVRHLSKTQNLMAFHTWIAHSIDLIERKEIKQKLLYVWDQVKFHLISTQDGQNILDALAIGRQIIFTLAWLACGILLALDSERDNDSTAHEVAGRWVLEGQGVPGEFAFSDLIYHHSVSPASNCHREDKDRHMKREWDCRIVWGLDLPSDASRGYRFSKI